MLVLTRKLNQSIVLTDKRTGQKVEVFLVEVRGDQVRLGFDAPPHIVVDRSEIAERKRTEEPRPRTITG